MADEICLGAGEALIFSGLIIAMVVILLWVITTLIGKPQVLTGPRGGHPTIIPSSD